jgi:hypothetical protein
MNARSYEIVVGPAICRVELKQLPGSFTVQACVYLLQGGGLRPVLNASERAPVFMARDEQSALSAASEFLAGRFGTLTQLPVPCDSTEPLQGLRPVTWSERVGS